MYAQGPTDSNVDILGPSISDFWSECSAQQPVVFGFAWITAPVLACVAVFISARHNQALRMAPVTGFRQIYLRCSGLPMINAVLNLIVIMTTPRAAQLQEFNLSLYSAFTLSGFGNLLFQLLSLESFAAQGNDTPSLNRDATERVLHALAAQGKRKHFAKPPLGCFFGSCMTEHDLSSFQLLACFMLLQQYTIVLPVLTVSELYTAVAAPEALRITKEVIDVISKFSEFAAIWGLMVLYAATHDLLHRWKTTQKFIAIKLLIAIGTLQAPIIGIVVGHLDGPLCLDNETMTEFWNCWFLLCWSVVLAVLMRRAFPPNEVMGNEDDLYIPGNFEVDLKRHHQRSRRNLRTPRNSDHFPSALGASLVRSSAAETSEA